MRILILAALVLVACDEPIDKNSVCPGVRVERGFLHDRCGDYVVVQHAWQDVAACRPAPAGLSRTAEGTRAPADCLTGSWHWSAERHNGRMGVQLKAGK